MNVTIDTKKVNALLSRAIKETPRIAKQAMDRATANASNELVDRVQSGGGLAGMMRPYSDSYARYRQKKGRQANFVDLNFTGNMLGSITPFKSKIYGRRIESEIRPARAAEKKKVFYTDKQRKWWGLSSMEQSEVGRDFARQFGRLFKVKVR